MDLQQHTRKRDEMSPVESHELKPFSDEIVLQFQPNDNDELPIELTNTTGTYLQDINEDCLLEIFAVKSLSLMDLCSLAETCTRFQQIIQRVLPKDLSIRVGDNGYNVTSTKYSPSGNQSSQDIERIFKNFGSSLSKVHLASLRSRDQWTSHFLLNLVVEYCADNLESLKIQLLEIPAAKLNPILKHLKVLDLDRVDIVGDTESLFADLDSLIDLRMDWIVNCNAILENHFLKLERFVIKYRCNQRPNIQSLTTFVSKQRKLKTLDLIVRVVDESGKQTIVEAIGNSCKELEELSLIVEHMNASHLKPLQELKSLKTLKLRGVSCEDFQFLSAFTKLRDLQLNWCDLPKDSNHLVGLIRRLTNLEELQISCRRWLEFVLDERTFSCIVAIVKGRPAMLTLKCKFHFDPFSTSCDKNQKVRLLPLLDD